MRGRDSEGRRCTDLGHGDHGLQGHLSCPATTVSGRVSVQGADTILLPLLFSLYLPHAEALKTPVGKLGEQELKLPGEGTEFKRSKCLLILLMSISVGLCVVGRIIPPTPR